MTGIFQRLFPVGKSQVYGNILCASVSVLMAHLQIELEAVVMVKLLIERDKKRGFFSLKLEDDRDAVKARQSFLAMMVSLRNLAKKYPDELKVDDL